ncbi:hypothetical protein BMYO_1536 [Bifidobacterium myosotis]|uniref:Uncharacterized protein n=1 Tax=Bifidobacterium myosotis TaxID=1630166 RepID=A0A261FJ04_9BIFI|nr:hypothetical protein BMYO_1536 [Bifidobacterium myosotis]
MTKVVYRCRNGCYVMVTAVAVTILLPVVVAYPSCMACDHMI